MLTGFILALREGLEAALLIAIVFSILTKKDENGLKKWIWLGSAAGLVASFAAAIILTLIRVSLTGTAEILFEGFSLLLAAIILTWVIFWMRGESRKQTNRLITKVESASNKFNLFGLAFLVVVREGVELSLFLLAAGTLANPILTLLAALGGLAAAVLLGWLWTRSTRRFSLQKFFTLTNILLVIFAAGLLSRAAHEFIEVGWLPALVEPLYDISRVIPANSALGEFLGSLVGFNPAPALAETLTYAIYLVGIIAISFTFHNKQHEK
jgi:high-affinity iron transporter